MAEHITAALEWARAVGYNQRVQEEAARPSLDELAAARHGDECKRRGDLTSRAIDKVINLEQRLVKMERENDRLNTALEAEGNKCELAEQRAQQAEQRITDTEVELNALRDWRRGLVRPGTERPKRWPVVAKVAGSPELFESHAADRLKDYAECWFDPMDIYDAANQDAADRDAADET